MNMGNWDIEFKRRQDAAYEKAKAQQRELVEQLELRGRAAEAEAKLRAAQSAEPATKAGSLPHAASEQRRKKAADALERTKQAIRAKCLNGSLALSKSARNNLSEVLGVSGSTIDRALKELRDEQSNYVK